MSRPSNPATPIDRAWLPFTLCAIAIFIGTVFHLAGPMWPVVIQKLLTDGTITVLWLLAAAGIGSSVLAAARISSESKALRFATAAGLGFGIISLLVLGLGLCGLLNRPVAIGIIAVGLVLGALRINLKFQISTLKSEDWLWLIVIPLATIAIVAALVLPGILWRDEPLGYDVMEYHLQVPREWYEAGRIVPLEHNVFSYFPFNVEMHYLLAMHLCGGPWKGMYVAQLMNVVFVGLTVAAVCGITKPHGAIVLAAVPWMTMLAPVAYNEAGLLLFGTLAVAWMIQARDMRTMLLAGAFAGFACGTKLTAVPMVLIAGAISSLSLRERGGVRAGEAVGATSGVNANSSSGPHPNPLPVGEGMGAFILAGLLTFSPWLIRNMIWSGNPVFPEATSIFGKGHFSDLQVDRWNNAHSFAGTPGESYARLNAFVSQITSDWRYGFVALPLGVVALALSFRRRESHFLAILILLQLIIWIGFTHLQGRFYVLAIPLAAMLIGQVELPGWNRAVAVAALFMSIVGFSNLVPRIVQFSAAIGMEDPRALLPENIDSALDSRDAAVVLVGDARAFWYSIPMSRLKYRAVFDVNAGEDQPAIEAWAGGKVPADAIIIVHPAELRRLSRTYHTPMIEHEGKDPYIITSK